MSIFRAARAAVFATVCVALAAFGHALAGETTVSASALLAGFGVTLLVAWVLAGTERSLATILGLLLFGQFALHSLFMAGSGMLAMDHVTGRVTATAQPAATGHGGAAMTLAHVLAAAVSAWWLRRGERAVWRLVRRAARPLLRLLDPPPGPAAGPRALVRALAGPPWAVACTLLAHSVVRRGPPAVSMVASGD